MPNSLLIPGSLVAAFIALLAPCVSAQTISFSQAQVDSGKALYKETCQLCHGSNMINGQFGTPLRGSFFQDKWKGKSVGELLAFVYEKMPPDKLMSLTTEEYTGAVAYILSRNDLAISETAMGNDKQALNKLALPW